MKTLISLFIYITTYAVSLVIFGIGISKRKKYIGKIWVFLAILIPSILSGLRFETGEDYQSYIRGFDRIAAGYESRFEISFQYLSKLVSSLGLSAQFMFFIVALIMMFFIANALYRKKDTLPAMVGLFAFLLLFYQSSYNIVRFMIAASISLYNIKNIENKKLFRFIVFTVLAGSFHISAFVMFPMYFVFNKFIYKKGFWKKVLLYIGTVFIVANFNLIAQTIINSIEIFELDYYTKYTVESGMLSMEAFQQALFYIPLTLIGFFKYKECKNVDESFHIYFSLSTIGTIILTVSIFLQNYVYRLADYFLIFNVFVIPIYYKVFKIKRSYWSRIFLLGFIVLFWLYWYFINGAHGTYHYNWIFNRGDI